MASRFRRRVVLVMLVLYTVFVFVITLSPRMPGTGFVTRLVDWAIRELHERNLLLWVDFVEIEFLGNILMFVPIGIFVALLIGRRWWWSLLLLGSGLSGFIEVCQLLFLPDRYPDVGDVLSNSIGFLLGAVFSLTLRLLVAHRDKLVEADRMAAGSRFGDRF